MAVGTPILAGWPLRVLLAMVKTKKVTFINKFYVLILFRTSLITWILTIILMQLALFYAGLSLLMTGVLMLLGNLSFLSSTFINILNIRIGYEDPPSFLIPSFGWCFWLCFVIGKFQGFYF